MMREEISENEETVTSDILAAWLHSKKSVLLIDCRGFLSQDKKLRGALKMRCNSIKIKRCKGNLPINDIIPDEATRGKLENGEYECVVIYDEKSITKIAKMVYQTITRTTQTRVAVLKGMSHVIHFGYIHGIQVIILANQNKENNLVDFRWYRRYGTDTSGYD
jgi:hypothetical protein